MNQQEEDCVSCCPKLVWLLRFLVFAQFFLIALLACISQSVFSSWYTFLIVIIGTCFGLWAISTMGRHLNVSPQLKKNAPLQTGGAYRFVRHPMYLALLVTCSAFVIASFTAHSLLIWLAILFVLVCKIHYEERILNRHFPAYSTYARKTKRIIPFVY